jgi:uncharacterized protein (DUF427 family)
VTLTVGGGPFGHHPGGRFNFELPRQDVLYFEDSPKRIRGIAGGETIVDSRRVKLLHEHGRLPVYYYPREDVRTDLLTESERTEESEAKGPTRFWSLEGEGPSSQDAAWEHHAPPAGAPDLAGHIAFAWAAMDEWYEEDEPMIVHARDPFHRIDILDTSRQVEIRLDGEAVAESSATRVLFETSLPPRWYFQPEDVRADLLVESDKRTGCAYKGFASYRSVKVGDRLEEDLVWCYEDPRPEAERIRGRLAFFNERVEVIVDGEVQDCPVTEWSPRRSAASS